MRVILNEAAHKYFNEAGVEYQSCSNLIGAYKQKFDPVEASIRYAEKHGQTPEYWRKVWEEKGEKASDLGHDFHKLKEDYVGGKAFHHFKGRQYRVRNQHIINPTDLSQLPDGIYCELTLWHHGYVLAGQADVVIIETMDGVRYVDIEDYKTNKKLDMTSYQFKNGAYKMMSRPLHHLMDCNYIHYELQQSVYAFFLECYGYKIRSLRLLHHPPVEEGADERVREPVIYDLHYRKRDVLTMIQHYTNNKRI